MSARTLNCVCTYTKLYLHMLVTKSAPMPNGVAHASTCVWPNLNKNKTYPTQLHLLTVSAPTPNRVCTNA